MTEVGLWLATAAVGAVLALASHAHPRAGRLLAPLGLGLALGAFGLALTCLTAGTELVASPAALSLLAAACLSAALSALRSKRTGVLALGELAAGAAGAATLSAVLVLLAPALLAALGALCHALHLGAGASAPSSHGAPGVAAALVAERAAAWAEPSAQSEVVWMSVVERWLVAMPVLWLCGVVGGALALCSPGAWQLGRVSFERRLAVRFLTSRNSETVSRITSVATLGVALGVWLVLSAIGVLSGFEADLYDKIVGTHAHLSVQPEDGEPLADVRPLEAALAAERQALSMVAAYAPVIEAPIVVVSDINYASGDLVGLDARRSQQVLLALAPMLAALSQGPQEPTSDGIEVVLGSELARSLAVLPGDRVRLLVPGSDTLTPLGPVPRMQAARVRSVVTTRMYEADARIVVMSLPAARSLLKMAPEAVTGLQVRVHRPTEVAKVARGLVQSLTAALPKGSPALASLTFAERNQSLFAALALERVVAAVVLAFIILVASFSVVNTLTMAIWQRRFEVAMLKAMGATDGSMLATFLWQGTLVGLLGTGLGAALGVSTLALLSRFGFGIPYEVYYLDTLPVRLAASDVAATVGGSLLVLFAFAVLPSQAAAHLAPAEALRDG